MTLTFLVPLLGPPPPGFHFDRGYPMDQRGPMPRPDRFRDEMHTQPPPGSRHDERNARDRNPRGGRRNEDTIGLSLLVRNISTVITAEDIRQAFGRIGEVRDVYMCVSYPIMCSSYTDHFNLRFPLF